MACWQLPNDWQMHADIMGQLTFLAEIVITSRHPDLELWSRGSKQVIMLELMVPWQERMKEANERKRGKYQPIMDECQQRNWKS